MKRIELLPKWYGKEEKQDRTSKMKKAVKELLESNLPEKAKSKLKSVTCDMNLIGDTYSRNYEIKIVNTYIDLFNALSK